MHPALPIDPLLDEVAACLRPAGSSLIIEAPPGAGKTTRLPARLLQEEWCRGRIVVTEPRRIAARLAAKRVAEERNCRVGDEVGHQVRFEDKTSKVTRLVYATEGLLLRQFLEDQALQGASVLVLDEVHERSADLDVLISLLHHARTRARPFRLVLMSATLDTGAFQKLFPDASTIRSEGRSFDVEVEHLGREDERPLPIQVRSAARTTLARPGDTLVFLPGGAEIRACSEALAGISGVETVPLHGDLPLEQQARAMTPGKVKRIILSTNVAESSVTIPNVTTVIDSGLARAAIFDPWSGVKRLETVEISQARIVQRSGRAGRVAAGHCLRLFTKGSYEKRPAQDPPPLLREDLSGILLLLLSQGIEPRMLSWLDAPSDAAFEKAGQLLSDLGASEGAKLTDIGMKMAQLPTSPRLSRMIIEGARRGILADVCRAAALLSERDIIRSSRNLGSRGRNIIASESDLEDRLESLAEWEHSGFDRGVARDFDLDVQTGRQVIQLAKSLQQSSKALRVPSLEEEDHAMVRALLSGFVDRVAERRGTGKSLVLSTGIQAELDESSAVVDGQFLLALVADAPGGRQRRPKVRLACRLDPDVLLDIAGDRIQAEDQLLWNAERQRLESVSRLTYGKVTLDESRSWAPPSETGAPLVMKAAIAKGPAVYDPEDNIESLSVRLALFRQYFPPEYADAISDDESGVLKHLSESEITSSQMAEQALLAACSTRASLDELIGIRLDLELSGLFPTRLNQSLERHLPLTVDLFGGHRLRVHYEQGRTPWVESRLQDFFSMTETPALCAGRLPIQLHLLAPNHRAIQVTTDLAGFWERHYPELRRQLMRRYPKHLWPEDGRTAKPPQPGRIR